MEAKEKSKELINKFLQVYDGRVLIAEKCALICVDELIEALEHNSWQNKDCINHYKEVKKEIEEL